MVHMHLKLHLGLCGGGGEGAGGQGALKGWGVSAPWRGGRVVWWWLMVSQHTKHSPWGPAAGGSLTECRGELATAGTGLWGHGGWCVCVKGWEGGREGATERCERGQTAGSAAAAFLVRGLAHKLVGVLGVNHRQPTLPRVFAGTYQERRADGRSPTNGRCDPPPRWRA